MEYGDTDGAMAQTVDKTTEDAIRATEQAQTKPEILPWNGRLKNHRLAARLLRQEASDGGKTVSQDVVLSATDSRRWQPPPVVTATLPNAPSPGDQKQPKLLAAKPTAQRIPEAVLSVPESAKRPDLALD